MLNLPTEVTAFVALFAPLFSSSVWSHAQITNLALAACAKHFVRLTLTRSDAYVRANKLAVRKSGGA
jgi:hypothetical protein